MEGLELWSEADYIRAYIAANGPDPDQWVRPGWQWASAGNTKARLPTFMKSIKRVEPPPFPAGIQKTSVETREFWARDSYRFPPYQYAPQYRFHAGSSPPRLADASEREILLGFGAGHTATCMTASDMKKSFENYEDLRKSLCGDSFCILSFSIMAAAMCATMHPRMTPQQIINRLGLAPGASASPDQVVPMSRWLAYGEHIDDSNHLGKLTNLLGLTVNHTGSDVRLLTGELMGKHHSSHASVRACWWQWKHLFKVKWIQPSHINFLEMKNDFINFALESPAGQFSWQTVAAFGG